MNENINTENLSNENIIPFTIGRMNPPTTGHMQLIREMMNFSLKNNLSQINIILSGTIDNKKNPISCKEKRNMLLFFLLKHQKELLKIEQPTNSYKIDELKINIICMDDIINPDYGSHPVMKSIQFILNEKYGYPRNNLKMILFIGQDRASDFLWLQKTLLERNPSIQLEIVPIERPDGAISATYIRQLAIDGNYDAFKQQMFDTGLKNEEYIRKLFDEIREKINYKPRKKNTSIKGGRRKKNSKIQKKNKSIRTRILNKRS
jgi:nicotinamide mononucleotide adenylyltransferase